MGNPVEEASKGAVEGLLSWTEEKIQVLLEKFTDKDIGFVEDKPTADSLKRQKGTSEYKLLSDFVPKGYLRVLVRMGLTLREMEGDPGSLETFRNTIYDQYGSPGVRIAELVQNGIVAQLLAHLVKVYDNPRDTQQKLQAFFDQVEQLTIFVQREHFTVLKRKRIAQLVRTRVDANPSQMVILFGRGNAVPIVLKILDEIKKDPREYVVDTQETRYQLAAFIFAPETRGKLASRWDTLASGR